MEGASTRKDSIQRTDQRKLEAGTFFGWVISGPATSIVSSGQHSGSYAAQAGSPDGSNGSSSLTQMFTAAAGDSGLAFWYDANCGSFNFGTDGAGATLTDATADTTSTVTGPDCPIGDQGWIQIDVPITAGHSYTLTLTNTATSSDSADFPTYTLFDDVSVY